MRLLVTDCEPADARDRRRASVGMSAGESYAAVLKQLEPGATAEIAFPADEEAPAATLYHLARYDAVFLSGSPLHVYDGSAASERQIAFMRAVFASGTPSFGSCAGLQVAVAAAGGEVGPMEKRREAGFARRIVATQDGQDHPLLRGRPAAWDAGTIHSDEVKALPCDATLLACNAATAVQAAEIRHDGGVFWGVQYHPELSLAEIAAALRRDVAMLVEDGLARTPAEAGAQADLIAALGSEPDRADLAWRLGVDAQVTDTAVRRTELRNFIDALVLPTRAARSRSEESRGGAAS